MDDLLLGGLEDPSGETCNDNTRGLIPFKTLGIPRSLAIDGWDRFFTYSVWDNTHVSACEPDATFTEVPLVARQNWAKRELFPLPPSDSFPSYVTFHDGGDGCLKIEDVDETGVPTGRRAVAVIVSHGPNGFGGYNSKAKKISDTDITVEEAINIIDPVITPPELFHSRPIDINGFDDIVMGITANDLLIPLKKSGAIVSIKELERQYLYTLFDVTFDGGATCTLNVALPAEPSDHHDLVTTPSIPVTYNTTSVTIAASQYCPGLITPPTPP